MCYPKVEEYKLQNKKRIKPYISTTIDPRTTIFSIQTKKKLTTKRQQHISKIRRRGKRE